MKIAEGAMARELRDRYAQMGDIVADLRRVAVGQPPLGPRGPQRKKSRLFALAAACAVLLAASGGVGVWRLLPPKGVSTPPAPSVQTPAEELLWQADFSGDARLGPPWKVYLDAWRCEGGTLHVAARHPAGDAFAFWPAPRWTDYAIECEFQHDGGGLGFIARSTGEGVGSACYCLYFNREERAGQYHDIAAVKLLRCRFRVNTRGDGGPGAGCALDQQSTPLSPGQFHKLRWEIRGNSLKAWLDGKPLVEGEDPDPEPIPAGGVALTANTVAFQPGLAQVRNLRVLRLAPLHSAANPPPLDLPGNPAAGDSFVNPRDGAELVWIPPGEFKMGTDEQEIEAFLRDFPQREPAGKRKWDRTLLSASYRGRETFGEAIGCTSTK